MTVSPIGSTTTSYVVGTTSVSSTTPTGSTTATSSTTASTTVSSTTSSTTVNYSSATASTTCSTTVSYGGASTTAIISSTSASTTYSINSSATCTVSYSSSTSPYNTSSSAVIHVTMGEGSSATVYSCTSSSTTAVAQAIESINNTTEELSELLDEVDCAIELAVDALEKKYSYLKKVSYVIEDGQLKIQGIMGGTISGIGSHYKLENVAGNEKLTNLLKQIDDYAKLKNVSKLLDKAEGAFIGVGATVSALEEIVSEENETVADKAGGAITEMAISLGTDATGLILGTALTNALSTGAVGAKLGSFAGPVGIIGGAIVGIAVSVVAESVANYEIDGVPLRDWAATGLSTAISAVGDAVVDASTAAWDWTKATTNDIMERISTTAENVANWAQDTLENAWNAIEDTTSESLDWIMNSGAAFASWITSW